MSKSLLLRQLQQNDRSYSTGKMNHLDNGLSDSNKSILKRSTSFKESKVFGNRDVTPGKSQVVHTPLDWSLLSITKLIQGSRLATPYLSNIIG